MAATLSQFNTHTINTSNTVDSGTNSSLIHFSTSSATVDYDTNVTPLYAAIGNSDWDTATAICERILRSLNDGNNNARGGVNNGNSQNNLVNEASIWVTRTSSDQILWRFLPIHSTCALSPPYSFLRLLIKLYPDSVKCVDYQGLLPIHYACGSQSSRECIYALLMAFPQGALVGDPRGMVPLHYLALWGPASGERGIVEMMLVATEKMGNRKDKDGNTPLKLAQNATYPTHNEVANQIANHVMRKGLNLGNSINSSPANQYKNIRYSNNTSERNSSFDELTMDSNMMALDKQYNGGVNDRNCTLLSFGDMLEDEEREEEGTTIESGSDSKREVGESIEVILGGSRTPRNINNVWNKLGLSPVHKSSKTKINQHMTISSNDVKSAQQHDSDNRSILSDPLAGITNQRTAFSHRRMDQIQGPSTIVATASRPTLTHHRTFSWDVGSSQNKLPQAPSTNSLIDKYTNSRHNRDPSERKGLPPISPRSHLNFKIGHQDTIDDTGSSIRDFSIDVPPSKQAAVSRDEYEKVKTQLLKLKSEKEHVDTQLKLCLDQKKRDFVVNDSEAQSNLQERHDEEKNSLKEREEELNTELVQARKRIMELESQLSEVDKFRKNAVETFGKDAAKQKGIVSELESQLKAMKETIASNDAAVVELEEEKKRAAELETQVSELKVKIDAMQRTHGEAVYSHLQEVRSLRASLEKAMEGIEKSKAQSLEMDAKEKQWKVERASLEAQIESSKQNHIGGSIIPLSTGPSSEQWKEERTRLEFQIRSLTEASWSAQNAEYAIKADLSRKELEWKEERTKLEAEVKHLKDVVKESNGDGLSISSSLIQSNNSLGENQMGMKMQADGAIRKEDMKSIADLESELEKERSSKKDFMSEIVTLRQKVSKLESTLAENDAGVEVSLYGGRKYRGSGSGSMDEIERTRKTIDAVQKEAEDRENSLRSELNQAHSKIRILEDKLGSLNQENDNSLRQLNEGRNQIRHLEDGERVLRKELDQVRVNHKDKIKEMEKNERHHREEVRQLENKVSHLEKREQLLKSELADMDSIKISGGFSSDKERTYYQQLHSVKNQLLDLQSRENGYLLEIRELKKQITELESNDHGREAKLWEAQKSHRWTLQEKEDEFNSKIRDIKKEYENTITDIQNKHLKELRVVKRELHSVFCEKEDSYMQQLRDAKRREQALQDREDDLIQQISDVQLRSSLDDLDIDDMFNKKDDEFARLLEESAIEKTAKIDELTSKVESLELQLASTEDAGMLKKELTECKKELDKQRRKYTAELNKLQNVLDVQKSKEARLQSHIKSMESQITEMVSDYESRLEEAYYATAAVKGALK